MQWDINGHPFSERFNDIYFSRENGLLESTYVFLSGINAPQCWQGKKSFVIGEYIKPKTDLFSEINPIFIQKLVPLLI